MKPTRRERYATHRKTEREGREDREQIIMCDNNSISKQYSMYMINRNIPTAVEIALYNRNIFENSKKMYKYLVKTGAVPYKKSKDADITE